MTCSEDNPREWVLVFKLRSSGLVANVSTGWAINLAGLLSYNGSKKKKKKKPTKIKVVKVLERTLFLKVR